MSQPAAIQTDLLMPLLMFGLILLSTVFGAILSLLWRQVDMLQAADKELRGDMKDLTNSVSELADKVSSNKTETVTMFVTKEDLRDALESIGAAIDKLGGKWSDSLTRIYDKLDGKADRVTRPRAPASASRKK